jgi:hypothetical protein
MDRRIASLTSALLVIASLITALPMITSSALGQEVAPKAAAQKVQRGTSIKISGRVLDTSRTPLGGVTVLLETAKYPSGLFKKRKNREAVDKLSLPTTSDAEGFFAFDWPWDPYYDTFALAVALPINQGDLRTFEILHRTDITVDLFAGTLREMELVVEESEGLVWLRRFLGAEASEDERRIFEDLGRPDRYDAPTEEGGKAAWWYFTAGKVYWFKTGHLDHLEHFEPIPPLE